MTLMHRRSRCRKRMPYMVAASICLWVGLWWLAAVLVGKEILLPTPLTVGKRLWELMGSADYWQSVGNTLLSVFLGILCAVVGGSILAVLMYRLPMAEAFFRPILTAVRCTPVASFIILAYVWIAKSGIPFTITLLMGFPVVCTSVLTALESVEPELAEVAALYGYSADEKLRALYIPTVLPSFCNAVVTVCGLGWKAGVAAEALVRVGKSIGGSMMDAKVSFETADVFAWTLTVIAISMVAEALLRRLLTPQAVKR